MTNHIDEFNTLLKETQPVSNKVPSETLRVWRARLVGASVTISYAIGVLSIDIEYLTRALQNSNKIVLDALVEKLPEIVTSGWVGGGWSLSPDAAISVKVSEELSLDDDNPLLALHAEMASCDFENKEEVLNLLIQVNDQIVILRQIQKSLEERTKEIQFEMRDRYAKGTASIDDWLQ